MKCFTIPLCFWLLAVSVNAAERVALVIGNNSYKSFPEAKQLTSPRADAEDLAAGLRAIGFTVLAPVLDGTRDGIVKAKAQFLEQAKDAEIALFYFSGHGFQVGEENFLIPSDMPRITSYTVLKDNALMLRDSLMVGLEETGAKTKVIILDCCRDNPFAAQLEKALNGTNKSLRTKGGTGEISGYGPGFYLAFATSPGTVADDGNGKRNSPFTSALLTHLKDKAGENIRDLFDEVKETVREISGVEQVPWTNDSLSKSHLKVLAKLNLPAGVRKGASENAVVPGAGLPKQKPDPVPTTPGVGSTSVPATSLEVGEVGKVFELKLPGTETMKFCYCPPGTFMMGSPKTETMRGPYEKDQVNVTISKGFWMAQTECTEEQWDSVVRAQDQNRNYPYYADLTESERGKIRGFGRLFKGTTEAVPNQEEQIPFSEATYDRAVIFCKKAGVNLPVGWRIALPTEAQWEYACRAGTTTAYSFGDELTSKQARFQDSQDRSFRMETRVASYPANSWGLYDMHGNVAEWCSDWFYIDLAGGIDPTGPATGSSKVMRGGFWNIDPYECRSAARKAGEPNGNIYKAGFRPVLVPEKP